MRMRPVIVSLLSLLLLAACSKEKADGGTAKSVKAMPAVTGTVSFTDRVALPPEAVLNVRLVDASNLNQKPQVMVATQIAPLGRPPIAFALEYDGSRIDKFRTYLVEAEILKGPDILFLATEKYPVLSQGKGNHVQVVLASARVSEEVKPPKDVAIAQFQNLQSQIGGMTRLVGDRMDGEVPVGWDAFLQEGSLRMVRDNFEIDGARIAARYAYKNEAPWIVVQETTGKGTPTKILLAWNVAGELIVRDRTRGEKSDEAKDADVAKLTEQAKAALAAVNSKRKGRM